MVKTRLDCDVETKTLKLSLFFPSLPVGTVGGVAMYPSQNKILGLQDAGSKRNWKA